jgi:hypothetical protein
MGVAAGPRAERTGAREDNGFYELASTGSLTGGANITMSTAVPPCSSQDAVTDIFEPDGDLGGLSGWHVPAVLSGEPSGDVGVHAAPRRRPGVGV